jgi:hypothetical protein
MSHRLSAVVVLLASVAACSTSRPRAVVVGPPGASHEALDAAPPDLRPAARHAMAAATRLQTRLAADVVTATVAEGAARALAGHGANARAETQALRRELQLEVGRTSDRLRADANRPPAWAEPWVTAAAGLAADEVGVVIADLGDAVGVLVPVAVRRTCLDCHAPENQLDDDVRLALAEHYPRDAALGYGSGDHRGFTWAVAGK